MSFDHPKAGPNSVPSYQLSGIPYVTGSGTKTEHLNSAGGKEFNFPQVTRFVTFSITGSSEPKLYVAFASEGLLAGTDESPEHFFVVPPASAVTLDVRCKAVFVKTSAAAQWSMCAGLTPILSSQFPVLTGSLGFHAVGGLPSGSIDDTTR
tara:strand:+ start:96 stop:548 length:453 start_codon:yes stop_codon:yes gene_type:complete